MSISSPPPPYLTPSPQQSTLLYSNNGVNSTPQSSSTSTSLLIFTIVVSSAVILSASLYILIRFLSRRFRSTAIHPPLSSQLNPNSTSKSSDTDNFFNVLPLFSFRSIAGEVSGGDCAVCLSKFEPDDQLRLLPLCAHAFHADCIDTWLTSNSTCPLCRSTVHSNESDALNKILPASENRSGSFRIEIGSVSRRRSDAVSGESLRSYAIGSFEYVVDEEHEIPIGDVQTHRREVSDFDKDSIPVTPEEDTAAEVTGERGSWLRDYVDRIATASSRSFRSSGRFFSGSSGRSNAVIDDIEANTRVGEEISEMFRWLSGV